jgi:hypothetical protein
MAMPDLTMPQVVLILGLIFAWLVFDIARALFER